MYWSPIYNYSSSYINKINTFQWGVSSAQKHLQVLHPSKSTIYFDTTVFYSGSTTY